MTRQYDVVVLGGGIGGYTAAIRLAQLGKKVAIVEKDKLGGTCLHRGCIPSKALLRSAELYDTMKHSADFGINADSVSLNFAKVQERKQAIVDQLHKGLHFLMDKNKIEVFNGKGTIIGPSIFSPRGGTVNVELAHDEVENLVPEHLIIATGSRPKTLPGVHPDGKHILTSDDALLLSELPKSVIIVGGGVIGVEWASLLHDFGVDVTVVEAAANLVPAEDKEISRELERLFKKRGIRLLTNAKLLPDSLATEEDGVRLTVAHRTGETALHAEKLLLSVGREALTDHIGLDHTEVALANGVIKVNEFMQTTESHIYAVGDVNGGYQLAHVAAHEGLIAAEHIAGVATNPYPPRLIPRCIYTRPEIAAVGITEDEAKAQGYEIKTGKFSFKALGKALVLGETDGFVKVVADAKTDDLLGVHMIGPHVTDLVSEAALAQILAAAPWEVGFTIHPHPTLAESLGEAMLAVDGRAINI
ncbi:MAG TPA: dihydrolipoyl dehydrogenase [Bacilli bacterium]